MIGIPFPLRKITRSLFLANPVPRFGTNYTRVLMDDRGLLSSTSLIRPFSQKFIHQPLLPLGGPNCRSNPPHISHRVVTTCIFVFDVPVGQANGMIMRDVETISGMFGEAPPIPPIVLVISPLLRTTASHTHISTGHGVDIVIAFRLELSSKTVFFLGKRGREQFDPLRRTQTPLK